MHGEIHKARSNLEDWDSRWELYMRYAYLYGSEHSYITVLFGRRLTSNNMSKVHNDLVIQLTLTGRHCIRPQKQEFNLVPHRIATMTIACVGRPTQFNKIELKAQQPLRCPKKRTFSLCSWSEFNLYCLFNTSYKHSLTRSNRGVLLMRTSTCRMTICMV